MFSRTIALTIVLSVGAMSAAVAAPNCSAVQARLNCSCAVPILPNQPVALLSDVGGDVKKTGEGSYTPINASSPLGIGDGVLLGKDGHAQLTAEPACKNLKLGAFTSVTVREVEGCACITSVDANGAPVLPVVPAGSAAGLGPVAVVGAGAAGVFAIEAADDQNSP